MSETLPEKIKRLHEENQNFFDKVLLALSVAMFPILMQFYDKLHFESNWIFGFYIACFVFLSCTLILFLVGFLMARNGCDKHDELFAEDKKTDKEIKELEKQKDDYYRKSDNCEKYALICIMLFFICTIMLIILNINITRENFKMTQNNKQTNINESIKPTKSEQNIQKSNRPTNFERSTPNTPSSKPTTNERTTPPNNQNSDNK